MVVFWWPLYKPYKAKVIKIDLQCNMDLLINTYNNYLFFLQLPTWGFKNSAGHKITKLQYIYSNKYKINTGKRSVNHKKKIFNHDIGTLVDQL